MTDALSALAAEARRHLTGPVWDFIEGGAGDERTVAANVGAFDRIRIAPRMLRGGADTDTSVRILGDEWSAPVGIAPLAYHALAHPDGELATAAAAEKAGAPLVVSTMASRRLEDVAAATAAPLWFQLYPIRSRAIVADLVHRAETAGYRALVFTVDTPYLGERRRDARNDFRLPPGVRPVNLDDYPDVPAHSPQEHARVAFDPGLGWEYLAWLRSITTLPVVVKGILRGDDAARAVAAGARGIIVSNHGGRQLDGAVATLDALPEVAGAVAGRCVVLLDGGVRRGSDVLVALAGGAQGVFLGRPVLHALAAGGATGLHAMLVRIQGEFADAMRLGGAARCAELDRSWVRHADPPAVAPPPVLPARLEPPPSHAMSPDPLPPGVLPAAGLHGSVNDELLDTMTFLNEITERFPHAISFAPGRPVDVDFRLDDAFELARAYVRHRAAETGQSAERIERSLLQYGHTAGVVRDLLAAMLAADEGITVDPESIVVTVGAQEAMLLLLRTLFGGDHDVLAVSSPCYVGITGAARLLDIRMSAIAEPVPGADGPDLAAGLDAAVARAALDGDRIRACYVVPDAANPSGATLSTEQRLRLIDAAVRHDVLIVEDSPYRAFTGADRPPSLKSLDRGRHVVQLGSFAKTIYPGLRVGYLLADQEVRRDGGAPTRLTAEVAKVKSMVTLNTSGLSQAVVGGFLLRHGLRPQVAARAAGAHYRAVLDRMLSTLEECFPAARARVHGVHWNRPDGGFFLTLRVPFRADAEMLRVSAGEYGVVWTPMSYFHPEGGGSHAIRLSCSSVTPERAVEGIRRLARMIDSRRAAEKYVDG